MKIAVVFYSFGGNTRNVARVLSEYLKKYGEVSLLEIKALDEAPNLEGQSVRAKAKTRAVIEEDNLDLSAYDLVVLGTPVWWLNPSCAMNTYLDKCTGVANKPVILFATYFSGSGLTDTLDYMQKVLADKGAKNFKRFAVQHSQCRRDNDIRQVLGGI